jgi:dihydrofolate reductase
MATFRAIVAMGENREIGEGDKIPWRLKADMQHFKRTTMNGHVLFGRKTFDCLPNKTLVNRTIWVLTRRNPDGWTKTTNHGLTLSCATNVVESLSQLPDGQDYWVCGGSQIYSLLLDKLDEVVCTHVSGKFSQADAHMSAFEHLFARKDILTTGEGYSIVRYYDKITG